MKKNLYVDFHVIQTVPPSCVNRDDTGSPKTAIYGGTMRSRVSSQAWKHAMRRMFMDQFQNDMIGYRTKKVSDLLKAEIINIETDIKNDDAKSLAEKILEIAGVSAGSEKKGVLFFISSMQLKGIAKIAIQYKIDNEKNQKVKEKKYRELLETALKQNPSVDILLFGRMAASNPILNYDAAAQVAHSISTHTISNEYDYFTAVDDCSSEDNAGAGHLGTIEFNSSTLYRYATVNIRELSENLLDEKEISRAVCGFADAFIRSMPTGRQNTFANRTLPDMVYVVIRSDQPANFVGAFEKPIIAGEEGNVIKSMKALFEYADKVYSNYISRPEKAWIIGCEEESFGETTNLQNLLEELNGCIREEISKGE